MDRKLMSDRCHPECLGIVYEGGEIQRCDRCACYVDDAAAARGLVLLMRGVQVVRTMSDRGANQYQFRQFIDRYFTPPLPGAEAKIGDTL